MLAREIIQEIQRGITSEGVGVREISAETGTVRADIRQADGLAAAFDSLALRVPGTPGPLAEVGRSVAGRLTYLLEPLVLLEASVDRALLRSMPPTVLGDAGDYYELWLGAEASSGTAELRRYRAYRRGQGREPLPMTFTWELVERLVDDLHAVLGAT